MRARQIGRSAEREGKGFNAGIEELDLEQSLGYGLRLPDQLIQPLFGNRTLALIVDVDAVGSAWRLAINEHAKPDRAARRRRSHDEMQITGVKAVRHAAVGLVQRASLPPDRPLPRQRPIVEAQAHGQRVCSWLVEGCT